MQKVHHFVVNGESYDVLEDEVDEFLEWADGQGLDGDELMTFKLDNGETVDVPTLEAEDFGKWAETNDVGYRSIVPMQMDDGETLDLDEEDMRQFVQARRQGMPMSRGMLAQTGIPDWYGKSREDREALADQLGAYYPDEQVGAQSVKDENLGDAISNAMDYIEGKVEPIVEPAVEAAKGFGEGLARSVTDPANLWEETYGKNTLTDSLKNANAYAGKMVQKVGDIASTATGGQDTAVGRAIGNAVQNIDTTPVELYDDTLNAANEKVQNAMAAGLAYQIPGAAAVDAMGQSIPMFQDTYNKAIENGASYGKALALASARSGLRAADVLVDASAVKGLNGGGFLRNLMGNVALGAGFDFTGDVVDQLAEGKSIKDVDYGRSLKYAGSGAIDTALMAGVGAAGRKIAGSGEVSKADIESANRINREAEAKRNYERTISDEAKADIERNVNEMVKSEVIPSYRHAEEVAKLAEEKLGGRVNGESAEAVQQAVMEAAQEVQTRLQTPERVTTPALERRQTEAEMRKNERKSRLNDEYVAESAREEAASKERKGAEINADLDAQREAYDKRKADITKAFNRGDQEPMQQLIAERDAEMSAYEKSEAERKAREAELENRQDIEKDAAESPVVNNEPQVPTRENRKEFLPEYVEWLNKSGRNDSDKNWNRFIAENNYPEAWRIRDEAEYSKYKAKKDAKEEAARKEEAESEAMGRRIEEEGEIQRRNLNANEAKAQAEYDEAMTAREESKGKAGHDARQAELEKAFGAEYDAWKMRRDNALKKGYPFAEPEPTMKSVARQMEFDLRTTARGESDSATSETAFRNWAKDKNGKPYVFATKEQEAESRRVFEHLAKIGRVDPRTGEKIEMRFPEVDKPLPKASRKPVETAETKPEPVAAPEEPKAQNAPNEALIAASKVLKEDAYLPEKDLRRKLVDWKKNVNSFAGERKAKLQAQIDAAETILAERNKGTEVETPAEPVEPIVTQSQKVSQTEPKAKGPVGNLIERHLQKRPDSDVSKVALAAEELDRSHEITGIKSANFEYGILHLTVTEKIDGKETESHYALDSINGSIRKPSPKGLTEIWTPNAGKDKTPALAKQPTALANATEQAKTDAANRLAKMETADLQDTRASLIAANETEPSKKIGKQIADIEAELNRRGEPLAMIDDTSMDSKLTDPDFIAWANKSARTPSDSARRTYDAQQVDAVIAQTKNWAGNVKVVKHDTHAEVPDGARQIYSKDGNVVGYFDKGTKQIHLLPNADAKTVAHELGWHATYDYAEQLAAGGDRRLLDKMNDYANGANNIVIDPATGQTLASSITGRYGANGVTDPRAILDEIGAGRYTMDNVAKIKDAAARRQAAGFFERASTAIRDGVKSMLTKMGFNKVDLTGIDAMTPEQAMGFLSDQMLKGKRLGKLKDATPQIDMHSKAKASSRYVTTMKDHLRPIDEIEKEAGKTTDSSAYTDMRLLPGKVQKVINEAETFSKEIGDYCKKNRISIDELNEYMYAKAAEQRNATIMARNGRADGSAMSDADIQRIKAAYAADPAKERMLETARQKVLDFQRKGFHERVRSGLISAQDAANMEAAEPDHVPMRSRFNKDGDFEGFNGNEGFANREFRTAKGRTNLADGPLGWILQEYVDAYSRGAENEARQKLLSTVIANPEVGSVRQLRPGESVNEIRRKGQSGDANVFAVKANGNTYEVKLNGERGERIVAALTGRDMKGVAKALQGGMRIYSSAATAWSPTFAARNLIADTIDVGAVNIGEHGLVKGTVKNAQHIGNAVKHVKGIREYIKTGKTNDAVVQEAIDAGVLMGGGAKTRAWTGGEADADNALNTIRTDLKKGMSGARAVGKFLGGWVDNLNQTAEMMNRVADYEMQRKDGATKKEAALHAREITVDFNQKGTMTPWLNTAYMFSNAALGSSVRLAKAIAVNPKTGKVNWKNGGQLVGASVLTGVIEAALEHAMNGDDEEGKNVNEYTRFNSFAVRKGKNVIRVPVHPSPLSLAKYGGNLAYRYATGQLKKGDAGYNFGKETMDVIAPFLGVGSMGDNLEATMIPTLAQPFYQHWNNTDYAGRPIKKRTFDDVTPESHNGRNSTPEMYKALAEWMNDVTGGNEARKGKIDVAPEILQHYAKSLGKNVLTDITQTADAIQNIAKGIKGEKTEWDRRNIPVVKDYLRSAPDNTDRYFKAHDAYEADLNEWNKRKVKMSAEERADYAAKHPWVKREKYVNRLTNGYAMESGVHAYGINDYRKLISGKRRLSNGNWVESKNPPTDEQIESWTKKMLDLQAKMLAVMGK